MDYLTPQEIAAREPYRLDGSAQPDAFERLRQRMRVTGQWHARQNAGRAWPIGCVSLEVTQRCNLDCTLCYLSEASEAVKDMPLAELLRRVDMIHAHYGARTDIQVSGGEPTLRRRSELIAVVRHIRDKSMRASLFTNGILASRGLLAELAAAGLKDVAFHVDITQQRAGFSDEIALNRLRRDYIERARGLGLKIFFNTTVCADNVHQIPDVVRFFVAHADAVNLGSFQLQADTGRGVLGARENMITQANIARRIRTGAGCELNFDATDAGHPDCNRYALGLVVGGRMHDALDEPRRVNELMALAAGLPRPFDRSGRGQGLWRAALQLLSRHPGFVLRSLPYLLRRAARLAPDWLRGHGQVHALAFFIHNFMDAGQLEGDRIDACVFMVATQDGPMSMCLYNAKRDDYLLRPIAAGGGGEHALRFWNPVTGRLDDQTPIEQSVVLTRKTARGRARRRLANAQRTTTTADEPGAASEPSDAGA